MMKMENVSYSVAEGIEPFLCPYGVIAIIGPVSNGKTPIATAPGRSEEVLHDIRRAFQFCGDGGCPVDSSDQGVIGIVQNMADFGGSWLGRGIMKLTEPNQHAMRLLAPDSLPIPPGRDRSSHLAAEPGELLIVVGLQPPLIVSAAVCRCGAINMCLWFWILPGAGVASTWRVK
jgi:hypothetical protein